MSTGTAGLAITKAKTDAKKTTVVMQEVAMATCCQNQY